MELRKRARFPRMIFSDKVFTQVRALECFAARIQPHHHDRTEFKIKKKVIAILCD